MPEFFDVAIIGGGVMGSSVAYHLTADPGFKGSVLVVEKDPSYDACSTTRSWGGIRQQFSTPENIQMGLYAAEFIRKAPEALFCGEPAPDLGFRNHGYMFLASENGKSVLQANVALQQELGAKIDLLTPEEAAAQFPYLNVRDLAAASYGGASEGWIDPSALLQAFKQKAISQGAQYRSDVVTAVSLENRRIDAIRLAGGDTITCGVAVNAAGPHAGAVAKLAGCDLPVSPRKRHTYVFDCREPLPGKVPLTIDPTGLAFRPEGAYYLAILSPPEDQDHDCLDLELDYAHFDEVIWPILAGRVPQFEAIKLVRGWAGHYDYNRFDQNAVIGAHPEVGGLLFLQWFQRPWAAAVACRGPGCGRIDCGGAFSHPGPIEILNRANLRKQSAQRSKCRLRKGPLSRAPQRVTLRHS